MDLPAKGGHSYNDVNRSELAGQHVSAARKDPLPRLPCELWAEVTLMGAAMDPDFAFAFSHLSRSLRAAALQLPAAWTNVRLKSRWAWASTEKITAGILQRSNLLERSHNTLLAIDLDMAYDEDHAVFDRLGPILDPLVCSVKSARLEDASARTISAWTGSLEAVASLTMIRASQSEAGSRLQTTLRRKLVPSSNPSPRQLLVQNMAVVRCELSTSQMARLETCHGLVGTIRNMTWEAGYAGTCSPRSSLGVRQQAC